jgi:guanylate kinase
MTQKLLGNLKKGLFFILSAPAGTGKTTLIRMLTKEFDSIIESISYTTRKPRKNEIDGVDYFFISENEFLNKIKNNEFLEYAKIYNYYYGTSKEFVDKKLNESKHVVLVIDTQGAFNLKNKIDAISIFINPPSIEELKKRMIIRNDVSDEEIKIRLNWAKEEMKKNEFYDYNITNIDIKTSYEILRSIFISEEYKVKYLKNWRKN